MPALLKHLKVFHAEEEKHLFSAAPHSRIKYNGLMFKKGRFWLNLRRRFLMLKAAWPWNQLHKRWCLLCSRSSSVYWAAICCICSSSGFVTLNRCCRRPNLIAWFYVMHLILNNWHWCRQECHITVGKKKLLNVWISSQRCWSQKA